MHITVSVGAAEESRQISVRLPLQCSAV